MYGEEPGFAAAVLSGTLRCMDAGRSRPFAPTAFDEEMLRVADAAIAGGIPLGIVYSMPGTSAPVLLGAAGVVGAILNRRSLSVQVAVVSRNLTSRTLYDQLCINEQRLADFVPRTRVGTDGTPILVGRPTEQAPGRFHLTGDLQRVAGWIEKLDALVVDGTRIDKSEFGRVVDRCHRRVPLIYLTADPGDSSLAILREKGGAVWGWDSSCLQSLGSAAESGSPNGIEPVIAPLDTLRLAARSTVTIDCPENAGYLDEALTDLWRSLSSLSGVYRSLERAGSSWSAAFATRWAWGAFNLLSSLPVTPKAHDAAVGFSPYRLRLETAPTTARAYARSVGGEAGQTWYQVADRFDQVLEAASRQEKLAAVINWVQACVTEEKYGIVAVSNSAMAATIGSALAESTDTSPSWERYIDIATISQLLVGRVGPASDICLTGTLPRYLAGLYAIPPAPNLTVVTCGPAETARVAKQALAARRAAADVRLESLTVTSERLSIMAEAPDLSLADVESQVRIARGADIHPIEPNVLLPGENPWEPFSADVLQILEESASTYSDQRGIASPAPPTRSGRTGIQTTVEVITVYLAAGVDECVLLLEPNDLVSRRTGRNVSRVAAKALAAGSVLVLVDHAARSDLFESLTEKLAEHPVYATLQSSIDFWHRRARAAHYSGLSYREILAGMQQKGSQITSETAIGTWVRGEVDGPQDHADLMRFAWVVRDEELRKKVQEISIALTTLHRINRMAGVWLSAQMAGVTVGERDVLVDADWNIHVADLMEGVSSHVVHRVDKTLRLAPASAVGILMSPSEVYRATGIEAS